MNCPNCNTPLQAGTRRCPACGATVAGGDSTVRMSADDLRDRFPKTQLMHAKPKKQGARMPLWLAVVTVLVVALVCGLGTYLIMSLDKKDVDRELSGENVPAVEAAKNVPSITDEKPAE